MDRGRSPSFVTVSDTAATPRPCRASPRPDGTPERHGSGVHRARRPQSAPLVPEPTSIAPFSAVQTGAWVSGCRADRRRSCGPSSDEERRHRGPDDGVLPPPAATSAAPAPSAAPPSSSGGAAPGRSRAARGSLLARRCTYTSVRRMRGCATARSCERVARCGSLGVHAERRSPRAVARVGLVSKRADAGAVAEGARADAERGCQRSDQGSATALTLGDSSSSTDRSHKPTL